jgi:CelD/BcsL family acetyltransferase involved in cellulose biosynthesis
MTGDPPCLPADGDTASPEAGSGPLRAVRRADGLFPDTEGGRHSRVFFARLFELFGVGGPLKLAFLTIGGRRIAAGVSFETPDALLYYNAGVDPEWRDLSPGVLMVERYVRRAMERGIARIDFLRGNEPYKYEWGAVPGAD